MKDSSVFRGMKAVIPLCLIVSALNVVSADEIKLNPIQRGINDAVLRDLGNGEWEFTSTGSDPYFFVETGGAVIELKEQSILAFDYFSTTGIGQMLVFVGPVLDIAHLLTIKDVGRREGWSPFTADLTATIRPPDQPVTSLRITLGQHAGVVVRFRSMCARPATEQEKRLAAEREERIESDRKHSERIKTYMAQDFSCAVTSIVADTDTIVISGRIGDIETSSLLLAEVPMWEDITDLQVPVAVIPLKADETGRFSVSVSRCEVQNRERLLSAWAVVKQRADGNYEPLSPIHYVDEVRSRVALPPAKPRSLKGLGGCPFNNPDMQELGIASVTLNIILNDLFLDAPRPGASSYSYMGRTWYINDAAVANYDRDMRTAASNGWMVSAIILIKPTGNSPEGSWNRQAAHPDFDGRGIFVLPNFTSREGVNAYAAAMNFLTERYSRPDNAYGRVHHWIMHNEINSGFFWANAGSKTLTTYMDIYQKSMRVAYLLAHQYDSNAKPLISLDHCWTHCPDIRSYPARGLLETLLQFSHKEGDFPWGLAFHPYPQDIANPRTWEDPQSVFDFNTPFITFHNLEVLDAWVQKPEVAFHGSVPREIQFTEQGINSPDYSEKTLTDQAAGMAYAWQKIKRMKHVTAFQYHLWTDEPSEGGLRLGLRKFANDPDDPQGKKPIWTLFQALGTDAEQSACSFALPVVGLRNWDEVQHKGRIIDSRVTGF